MDRTVFHVTLLGPQWHVLREGESLATAESKREALMEAKVLAQQFRPSRVLVHSSDGTVEDEVTYDGDPLPPCG